MIKWMHCFHLIVPYAVLSNLDALFIEYMHYHLLDGKRCSSPADITTTSWTSPMMKICIGQKVEHWVYNEVHIGRVHEYFYHATQ